MPQLTDEIIDAAIAGFEQQRLRIEEQIRELRAMRSGKPSKADNTSEAQRGRGKRRLSAAARARIAAAQRKRWAALKGQSEQTTEARKPKRKMSAKGRRAIAEATRKRWAAFRAAKEAAAKGSNGRKTASRKALKNMTAAG